MKVHLNEKQENRDIWKSIGIKRLTAFILVVTVLLSGCVGENNAKSSAGLQTTSNPVVVPTTKISTSNTPVPPATTITNPTSPAPKTKTIPQAAITPAKISAEGLAMLLIKPDETSGRNLTKFVFLAARVNYAYTTIGYTDVLPDGMENIGQTLEFKDSTESRFVSLQAKKSSTKDNAIKYDITNNLVMCQKYKDEGMAYSCGSANLGDTSYYSVDAKVTRVTFVKGDNYVILSVLDSEINSEAEAMRLGKLVESRLK